MSKLPAETLDKLIDMQRRGWTQGRMAKELGIARETVNRALRRHNRAIITRTLKRIEEYRAEQFESLHHVASVAFAAWEESREVITVTKRKLEPVTLVEHTPDGPITTKGEPIEVEVIETTRQGLGNVAYLREMRGAMADIRALLGMATAKREDAAPSVRDLQQEAIDRADAYQPQRPANGEPSHAI